MSNEKLLELILHQTDRPFYVTLEFWTAAATLVALFVPLLVLWFTSRPKKSKLVAINTSVVNQDTATDEIEKNEKRLLNVGRVIVKNIGKFRASSVVAYLEKISFQGVKRPDFFPIPLYWTYGQLNRNGPTIRDLYPNQLVYLDIFHHVYDAAYQGNVSVFFSGAAGAGIDHLSKMDIGTSVITLRLYQESGQVVKLKIAAAWNGDDVPTLQLIG